MQQKAYNSVASLVAAGNLVSAGAATHAAGLGLVVATKPLVDADVLGLTNLSASFLQAKHTLRGLRTVHNLKRKDVYDLSFVVRDSLKRSFGRSYNVQWEGTGFTSTLNVPQSAARLEELLRSLGTFLTSNPQHEVEDVATAALVEAALTALSTARAAVTVQRGAVRTLLGTRKQKEKVVRSRLRGVVEELKRVIGPIDGRWDAFGLNQPGLQQVPGRPGKVIVVLQAGGAAAVKWQKTPRAEYYRLWLKVIGVDQEAIPVGSPTDVDFMIETMPSASQVEVSVSAINNGGESARSEVVVVIIP